MMNVFDKKRTKNIGVSVTEEEFETLRKAAFIEKKAVATLVRELALKEAEKINRKGEK